MNKKVSCFLARFILPICLVLSIGCSAPKKSLISDEKDSQLEKLQQKISYLISDPNLFNAQLGLYIESLQNGDIIHSKNEHKLFISASNMKIFTTAAALLNFGPRFRYRTGIYHSGEITAGILNGNLVIKGSGDPSIAPRFAEGDVLRFFRVWADSLLAKGISRINGDIIGDASYFQTEPLGYGWQWDDEPFWYSAQISALSFNDNCIDVTVKASDTIGQPPSVILSPPTEYFTVKNQAITTEADSVRTLFITRPRFENKLLILNQMPVNRPIDNESISVIDPAKFFVVVLKEVLEKKGIEIEGDTRTVDKIGGINYNDHQQLFTHKSPELSEIIRVVNKRSQNLYAEQLLITLAAEYGNIASASEGIRVVKRTLARMGITENEFLMHDGSGLSRVNLISPNSVGLLLRYLAGHRLFEHFYQSLPIGGIDGTLRNRMKKSPAQGKVRAKTGYVGHVRNLSGYVESADGEMFVFSILVNNYLHPTPAINLLQDRICALLANFSRN